MDLVGPKFFETVGVAGFLMVVIWIMYQYINRMQDRYDEKGDKKDAFIMKLLDVNGQSAKELEKITSNTQDISAKVDLTTKEFSQRLEEHDKRAQEILNIIRFMMDNEILGKKKR